LPAGPGVRRAQQLFGGIDQDVPLGAVATPAATQGLRFQTARSPGRTDILAHMGGVQVHPAEVRVCIGPGRQQALPAPGLAPAAEVVGMLGADLGIPAQVAGQGLACDVAQRVAGHGGGSVKRGTNRTAMIICRFHGHWIHYVHTPW
jgi:hypothetical protein